MGVDPQVRQQRVADGSRRKRDLAAVGVDPTQAGLDGKPSPTRQRIEAWIAENVPGENFHAVSAVRLHLKHAGHRITAASVREELKARDWAKEQRS